MKMRLSTLWVCLVISFVPGCQRNSDDQKARQLLAEINSIMNQQEASLRSLPPGTGEMFSRENLGRFPANRVKLEAAARDMMRLNDSHILRQREMAGKFDEISQLNLDDNFRRYARFEAEVFRKRAEGVKVLNERLALVLDRKVTDQKTFRARLEEVNLRLGQIDKETEVLEAQLASIPRPSVK